MTVESVTSTSSTSTTSLPSDIDPKAASFLEALQKARQSGTPDSNKPIVLAATQSDQGGSNGPDEQGMVDGITRLYNMEVGHSLEEFSDIMNNEVDPSLLNDDLKSVYKDGMKWRELAETAIEHGWEQLDNELMKITEGDFTETREGGVLHELFKNSTGDATDRMLLFETSDNRLTRTKEYVSGNIDRFGIEPGRIELWDTYRLFELNSWNNNPQGAEEFLNNVNFVVEGKVDGAGDIENTLDYESADVKGDDLVDMLHVRSDSALAELIEEKGGVEHANITYEKLVNFAQEEGNIKFDSLTNELVQDISNVESLLDEFLLGSPGFDRGSLTQNFEMMSRELDASNPDSQLSKILSAYEEVYDDIDALNQAGIIDSPAYEDWMDKRIQDILDLEDNKRSFLQKIDDFYGMAESNLDAIESQEKQEQISNILNTTFSALAALGSVGFGISNGRAVWGVGQQFAKTGYKALNLPAFFGSNTLFANNVVNMSLSAADADRLNDAAQAMGYSEGEAANLISGFENSSAENAELLLGIANKQQVLDYRLNEQERFIEYYSWAVENQDNSSLFSEGGDDTGYDGVMPYVTWEPGEAVTNDYPLPLKDTDISKRIAAADIFSVIDKPDWYNT